MEHELLRHTIHCIYGNRYKEAVNECSSALDAVPAYHKALVRRAKAYEQMGHFKQALSDIQKANKADTANPEIQVCLPILPHRQQHTRHGRTLLLLESCTWWYSCRSRRVALML